MTELIACPDVIDVHAVQFAVVVDSNEESATASGSERGNFASDVIRVQLAFELDILALTGDLNFGKLSR
jgi:hypothetical protein